ncbi:MAG TPA: NAD(P)-dependent oxidoreductase [Roseiarcus sp.]|nr:NAD(P)-dependent oxidoreductase [Roseiarcus sp.]
MRRILVTPRSLTASPHPAVERIRQRGYDPVYCTPGKMPDEAELIRLVPGSIGWLAGVEPISEAVISAARDLRAISRNGTGVDNLPMSALAARGIVVCKAEGANAHGVAELTIGLTLAALRHVPFADAGIKAGKWPRRIGREIRGRTFGVVGVGAVGREAARLATALGAKVLAYDPLRPPVDETLREAVRWVDLGTLLAESEIVSLHCPAPADGRPMIGADEFDAFPAGAVLVNTARAALVDEGALLAALESGQVDVYATDVFAEEPPKDLALAGHDRVIAVSHIGGFTTESVERATTAAVANLLEVLEGAS